MAAPQSSLRMHQLPSRRRSPGRASPPSAATRWPGAAMAPQRWSLVGRRHRLRAEPPPSQAVTRPVEELPERRVPRPPPGSSLPSRTVEPAPETGCVRDRFARIWRRRARRRIGSLRSLSWSVPSPALLLRRGGTVRIRANLACDPRCEDAIEKPVVCRSCCAEPERGAPVGRPRGSTARRGGRPRRGGCPVRCVRPPHAFARTLRDPPNRRSVIKARSPRARRSLSTD
jgi:hypothetical protein